MLLALVALGVIALIASASSSTAEGAAGPRSLVPQPGSAPGPAPMQELEKTTVPPTKSQLATLVARNWVDKKEQLGTPRFLVVVINKAGEAGNAKPYDVNPAAEIAAFIEWGYWVALFDTEGTNWPKKPDWTSDLATRSVSKAETTTPTASPQEIAQVMKGQGATNQEIAQELTDQGFKPGDSTVSEVVKPSEQAAVSQAKPGEVWYAPANRAARTMHNKQPGDRYIAIAMNKAGKANVIYTGPNRPNDNLRKQANLGYRTVLYDTKVKDWPGPIWSSENKATV